MKIDLESQKYRKEFRSFAEDVISPYAGKFDREERISDEVIAMLAQKGYLGSMLPKEYNGMGIDQITIGILNEEIGRACSSVRSLLTVHGMVALAILRWGTQEQRDYWLPMMSRGEIIGAFCLTEPEVGSDAKSIKSTAVKSNSHYILNGAKRWTTMGQIADIFLVFAQCEGVPTAFIVEKDTPGLSIKPKRGLLGARASMIADIDFNNCQLREENIIGRIGTGLSHVAVSSLDYGRYTIAWGCVGLGQICLEKSVQYARKRKQFGEPLRKHQLIQQMITEMVVNIKAARLLCYHAGLLRNSADPESIMETWNAKYFASKMVNLVANYTVQIHGANGCIGEHDIERYYRDARINEIIEGTTQMHEILIATNTFRSY
ncbi:MAG: acyl-CoA dehydrogenase family protein [Caulobacteraceae bacterium]